MQILEKSALYVVATPIGNLEDLSPRAVQVLKNVDVILAEDTRHSKPLLSHFGIHTPMQAYHEHNENAKSLEVVAALKQNQSYALISDAGTPVFSDPGARVVAQALAAEVPVIPIPGSCAAIAALSASGLAGLPFHFFGFLPAKNTQKHKALEEIKNHSAGTLCFYESPHRLRDTLNAFAEIWGETHEIVLAKELTKLYEAVRKGSIYSIIAWLGEDAKREQGEFVLLVENQVPKQDETMLHFSLDSLLLSYLKRIKLKDAVGAVVELTGLPKNLVYERALQLKTE